MQGPERIRVALVALAAAAVVVAGCGTDPVRYSDKQIIDKLKLEKSEDGETYTIDGDPFCEVELKLLNDRDEVDAAAEGRNGEFVIASQQNNVGVKAVPGFAPDCAADVRKKLNKLDPEPAD